MRVYFNAALMLGVASSLFTASLLTAYADDPAPVANDDEAICLVSSLGSGRYIDVRGNDTGTELRIQSAGPGQHGEVNIDDGSYNLTYWADDGFYGVDTFPYTVVDEDGQTSTAMVTVIVVTVNDYFAIAQDTAVDIPILTNEVDYFTPTIDSVTTPSSGGTATPIVCPDADTEQKLCIAYAPSPGFVGDDGFTYLLKDDAGNEITGTMRVSVAAAPAPEGQTPTLQVPSGGSVLPASSASMVLMALGVVVVAAGVALFGVWRQRR